MALEKAVVQEALRSRGLTENAADVFVFETEDQMKTTLDLFTPKSFQSADDLLADEKLKPLLLNYVDKRVGDAKKKWDSDHKPSDPPLKSDDITAVIAKSVQEAIKPLSEKLSAIESEKQRTEREAKIKALLTEALPEKLHSMVMASIPADADEAKIKTLIGEAKATLTGLGLKELGVPGGGDGTTGDAALKAEIDNWAKKQESKQKKSVSTKIQTK